MSGLLFVLHGLTLALVWFLVLNAAATLFVVAVAPRVTQRDSVRRPAFWLGLRLLPAVSSIGFVAAVFLPSYWKYEPREFAEGFDVTLAALAVAGLVVVATAAARGVTAYRRASRRAQAWSRLARPLTLSDSSMPTFEIDADAPIMALVGVLRPRLLITRGVLQALSDEELSASVAHEIGHQRAWDNLKRLAMRTAPDLLTTTTAARNIEQRWASASERVADRQACSSGRARCALASALVKVARLTPPVTPIAEPISTLVDGGEIASRVHSLLEDAPDAEPRRGSWHWAALALGFPIAALAYAPLLRGVHALTELIVNSL
jgi:Zn-dependent protease with chaperone function